MFRNESEIRSWILSSWQTSYRKDFSKLLTSWQRMTSFVEWKKNFRKSEWIKGEDEWRVSQNILSTIPNEKRMATNYPKGVFVPPTAEQRMAALGDTNNVRRLIDWKNGWRGWNILVEWRHSTCFDNWDSSKFFADSNAKIRWLAQCQPWIWSNI